MKETQLQINLPGVPKAKQGREVAQQWEWTEASVWTERMLAALERGVKGGKWFSLMDKVWKMENLQSAMKQVMRNQGGAGVDGQSCEDYLKTSPQRLPGLQDQLKQGNYRPKPVKRVWIPKLGSKELRPLGVPTVEDRVVQTALRNVLEPIFERTFADHSYGFRPGRGAKQALRRVDQLLKTGHHWVVDADLKGYFDSIPQDKLMEAVETQIADGAVLELIEQMLEQGVMESGKGWQPTETGTPQGAVISPLLANIYLNPLDQFMIRQGWQMVRYADDFVILCQSQARSPRGVGATAPMDTSSGTDAAPDQNAHRRCQPKRRVRLSGIPLRARLPLAAQEEPGQAQRDHTRKDPKRQTRKTAETLSGKSTAAREAGLNTSSTARTPCSDRWMAGYGNDCAAFCAGDTQVQTRAACRDHQRWPIAYFAKLGLISLALAGAVIYFV